jgi:hypothetical protein
MTLRLIEMVVPEPAGEELQKPLAGQSVLKLRQIGLGEVMVAVTLLPPMVLFGLILLLRKG